MKFCQHCGKEVLDDAIICPNCGCSVAYDTPASTGVDSPKPVTDSYSGLSIAGFVLSFVFSLLGLILSIVAHNDAKRTGSQKSLSISKVGIILSAVFLGISALTTIISVIAGIALGSEWLKYVYAL